MEFAGKGQPLTRAGLASVLEFLGIAEDDAARLWAVVEVETAGVTQGFGYREDRRPQMLFERHKFKQFTSGAFDQDAPDISGPPGGYGTLASQYDRLSKALALCETAGLGVEPALSAASWGLMQVMGFNHDAAGFDSAEAMVQAMVDSEDSQMMAAARFLVAEQLDEALRNTDWRTFAIGYNGVNYWQNKYDIKLGQQYERLVAGSLPNLETRTAQAALVYLGYHPGVVDGLIGRRTKAALNSFRAAVGLPAGDGLDAATYGALCADAGVVVDP